MGKPLRLDVFPYKLWCNFRGPTTRIRRLLLLHLLQIGSATVEFKQN
jgi:hypothetical protein